MHCSGQQGERKDAGALRIARQSIAGLNAPVPEMVTSFPENEPLTLHRRKIRGKDDLTHQKLVHQKQR